MITPTQERRLVLYLSRVASASLPVALFLIFAAPGLAAPAPPRVYTLASGSPQGVYFPLAQGIAAVAHKAGVEIRVLPSEGSKQNLGWLADGRVDLALTQSDVASDAYGGRGGFARPLSSLRVIAPLYTEAVHILIHRPLYIHRLEDLRGKRVAVGPAGSGTEANATQLLAAAGLTLSEVDARHLSIEDAMASLRQGQVDAAFVTSGIPSAVVKGVLADGSASLFEPDRDLLDRLRETCPFFLNKNIEASDYPRLNEEVTTAGVQALLVGRSNLSAAIVDRLVRALSASKELTARYALTGESASASDTGIPTFEPAQRFFAVQALLRRQKLLAGIILGALVLAFVVLRFQRGIWRLLRRAEFLRVGIYFSTLWITGSIALYLTEHRVNENYSNFWKSMWSGLITIYSLSSKEPLTLEGRVIGIIIFLLGLAGIVWLTERLASFYLEKKILPLLRGGFARMHKMKDHYVVVGWNKKGPGMLAQLHNDDLDQNRLIVILAKEGQADHLESHGLIQVERGERASEADLKRVHVQAAHAVIILAESDEASEDAKTILSILAVRKICSGPGSQKPVAVIAEIFDPGNVELASFAGNDKSIALEIVSAHKVGEGLLSHTAVHPGLSKVYHQLLAFSKGHSEIHRTRVPMEFDGKTFDALVASTVEQRLSGTYVLPIAIQRGSEVYINPTPTAQRKGKRKPEDKDAEVPWLLQKGDYLFAICDSPKDLKELYHPSPRGLLQKLIPAREEAE
ncbi:MAG TPA: TAXI family TRAP transporter solute-binding subunit [Thermoanaerobaculia bacterium]|jgi:TRAP transporter TAXI family solute receptor|nr:TAXI family TRAP transporter solute-binding subunit [Thermoanaerobaculia bacterium]